jgi:hypothetical protein
VSNTRGVTAAGSAVPISAKGATVNYRNKSR